MSYKTVTLDDLRDKRVWELEEAWRGNSLPAEELYDFKAVKHVPPLPDFTGLEAIKGYTRENLKAFSNVRLTVYDVIADPHMTLARWAWVGDHTGTCTFLPFTPTGKQVALVGATISHFKNGKIVEEWDYCDFLGFYIQLGLVPPLGT
jgi:predicted ester cyclase